MDLEDAVGPATGAEDAVGPAIGAEAGVGPATGAEAGLGPVGSDAPSGPAVPGSSDGVGIDAGPFDEDLGQAGGVTRAVEVEATPDEVWQAVADPDERALWLDDPDALARHVRVDESTPGHRLVWTWWRPGDEGDASTVSVVLSPVDGGGTRVVVTESLPAALAPRASASASALGGATSSTAAVLRPAPEVRLGRRHLWRSRLLGLELLFVAASVAVA